MGRRLGLSLALAGPSELVAFTLSLRYITQKIAQRVEVNGTLELAIAILYLSHNLREQFS